MIPTKIHEICVNKLASLWSGGKKVINVDPALEAYVPFRVFIKYLINKGFGGIAFRSARMALAGLQGKCLTLFNPEDAIYVQGEMEVYKYHREGCTFLKKY